MDEVRLMANALLNAHWLTARELGEAVGLNPRALRRAAHESRGKIISGQRGYCLFGNSSTEEQEEAVSTLRSRAKKITARADELERRMRWAAGEEE